MLTGRRAFEGEDVSDTLANVLKGEPNWEALPAGLSPTLAVYLKRCLQRDPKQRLGDIHDMRLALEGAFETGVWQTAESVAVPQAVWLRRMLPVAAALVVGGLAVGLIAWSVWPSPAPRPVSRSRHALPEGSGFDGIARSFLAMSPDGRQFVYKGTGGLYVRSMDTLEDQLISGSRAASTNPAFSPDGAWLAFWEATRLWKIPVVGGTPVPLTVASNILGVRWDQDDTILYNESGNILRVSADGGEPELLVGSTGAGAQLLPDGTTVLFQTLDDQVAVQSRESKGPTILFPGQRPTYLSTGHLVYVRDGVLFAVPFDARALQVTGRPVPLVDGVEGSPPQYAVSESGSLVYVASGLAGGTNTLALVDRDGMVEPLDLPPNRYRHPRLSPDGTRLAVQVAHEGGNDIWVYDLSGETAFRPLTLDGNNTYPIWTPDGERITYFSRGNIHWQAADGSGVAEPLTEDGRAPQPEAWSGAPQPEAWSPDGRTLSFRAVVSAGAGLWTLSLDDGNAPRLFYDIAGHQVGSAFSPDGKWLAYQSDQPQVYVQPFPPTGEIRQVSSHEASTSPVWSRDGTELFYRAALSPGRYTIVAVGVTIDGGFKLGVARALPIEGFSVIPGIRNFDVTPDGQRFLMVFPADRTGNGEAVRPTINIVENWFEELRQRVPTD
jgi:serine/threonine-protein kinase